MVASRSKPTLKDAASTPLVRWNSALGKAILPFGFRLPVRSLAALIGAAALAFLSPPTGSAQDSQGMKQQGPWVYSTNWGSEKGGKRFVAMTQAKETSSVWLGFSCTEDPRVFASIYDNRGFSAGTSEISAKIGLHNRSTISAIVKPVNDQIGVFDPATSKQLFLYAVHADHVEIALQGADHNSTDYTFRLQPNDEALKPIIDGCIRPEGA